MRGKNKAMLEKNGGEAVKSKKIMKIKNNECKRTKNKKKIKMKGGRQK